MKKIPILTALFVLFSSLLCALEERNYTKTVTDENGKAIMTVEMNYIGKKPIGKFTYPHDWRHTDTDFYNVIYTNLTDKPIEFIKMRSYSKFPVDTFHSGRTMPKDIHDEKATSDVAYRDLHKQPFGFGIYLKPHQSIELKNHFIHYYTYNVRYRDVTIKYLDKLYTYTKYYVYSKSDNSVAVKRYYFDINGISSSLPYNSHHEVAKKNKKLTRLLIAIHSSSYNANEYLANSYALAKEMGEENTTLIFAPHFLPASKIPDTSRADHIYWEVYPFAGTSKGVVYGTKARISPYEILDRIIDQLTAYHKNIKEVVIFGHSAGGQFVNRYAGYSRFKKEGIKLKYIVLAPSSYLYFDKNRAVEGETERFAIPKMPAKKYNRWKYGLDDPYALFRRNGVTAKSFTKQYQNANITYLVGSKDNNPNHKSLDKREAAKLQGATRLERAQIYYNYLQFYFGKAITNRQKLYIIQGVGHNSKKLMNSKEGRQALFEL